MAFRANWRLPGRDGGSFAPGRNGIGLIVDGEFPETEAGPMAEEDMARIDLVESTGTGPGEDGADRPLASFHGKWLRGTSVRLGVTAWRFVMTQYERGTLSHPDPRFPDGRNGLDDRFSDLDPPSFQISGFAPRTVPHTGVDHFMLYMRVDQDPGPVRRFPIVFPFFIDDREGRFLEIKAIVNGQHVAGPNEPNAGQGSGWQVLATTPILNLPCLRRRRRVVTTTRSDDTDRYTDDLVGVTVLHHRRYLLDALVGRRWSRRVVDGNHFATYGGSDDKTLKIMLSRGMFEPLVEPHPVPTGDDLNHLTPENVEGAAGMGPLQLLHRIRDQVVSTCVSLIQSRFVDAGFAGTQVLVREDTPTSTFTDRYDSLSRRAPLPDAQAVPVPFFHFFINGTLGATMAPAVGSAEMFPAAPQSHLSVTVDGTTMSYGIQTRAPIGEHTKRLVHPIRVDTGYFRSLAIGRAEGDPIKPTSVAELDANATKAGQAIATVMLHEVAHSLGMMHEAVVVSPDHPNRGRETFFEIGAKPTDSIMCSAADANPIDLEPYFSHQAKRIWQQCFGVSPSYANALASADEVPSWSAIRQGSDPAQHRVQQPNIALEQYEELVRTWELAHRIIPTLAPLTRGRPADGLWFSTDVPTAPRTNWRDNWAAVSWQDRHEALVLGRRIASSDFGYLARVRSPFGGPRGGYDS